MKTVIRSLSNGKFEATIESGCFTYINNKCDTVKDAVSWIRQKEDEINKKAGGDKAWEKQ